MPLSSTRVIHPRWSEHHQPTAKGAMTAVCRVERPALGTHVDPVTESTIPNAPVIVVPSGTACRVQQYMRAVSRSQAGQVVTQRRYRVSLPADSPAVDVKSHVVIEAAEHDAEMVGRILYVEDIVMGSERFQRDLVCSDNMG